MKTALLNATHPTYQRETWARYDALYRGGEAFRAALAEFLPRNPQEPDEVYLARKKEAPYTDYVGPIVDWFSAKLCSGALVIRPQEGEQTEPDPWYAAWKEDVDGAGSDLNDFLRERFASACVKGRSWWCVEMPDDEDAPAVNRAEWDARGLGGARIYQIENEQVLDWEVDERGALIWAIVYSVETPRTDPRTGPRGRIVETWKIYDRSTVETWAVTWDPEIERQPEAARLVGSKSHGFSRVPLVRLGFVGVRGVRLRVGTRTVSIRGTALEGFWLLARLADPQIAHFRSSAALDWNIKRTCYAMPVFRLASAEHPPTMGVGYFIQIGTEETAEWIAPPTDHLKIVSERCEHLQQEIYRVANQLAQGVDNNAAAIGRSGESKAVDAAATEVVLRVYGALVREAVEKTYDLLAEGRGDPARFSIEGFDTFNVADASTLVETATKAQALGIPSQTFCCELHCRIVDALLPNLDQPTKDKIREEIHAHQEAEEIAAAARAKPSVPSPAADEPPSERMPMNGAPKASEPLTMSA